MGGGGGAKKKGEPLFGGEKSPPKNNIEGKKENIFSQGGVFFRGVSIKIL